MEVSYNTLTPLNMNDFFGMKINAENNMVPVLGRHSDHFQGE